MDHGNTHSDMDLRGRIIMPSQTEDAAPQWALGIRLETILELGSE